MNIKFCFSKSTFWLMRMLAFNYTQLAGIGLQISKAVVYVQFLFKFSWAYPCVASVPPHPPDFYFQLSLSLLPPCFWQPCYPP